MELSIAVCRQLAKLWIGAPNFTLTEADVNAFGSVKTENILYGI